MIALMERLPTPPPENAEEEGEGPPTPTSDELLSGLRHHSLLPCLSDPSHASRDFGGLVLSRPAALLRPHSTDHVRLAVLLALSSPHLTLTPRGNAHSISGQALAGSSGIALDMSAMASVDLDPANASAWVGAGALWEDVLVHCLRVARRAPRSWTDYLRLTIGGTLSNGGISGQAFRYGPQACNATELEMVTGHGDVLLCSATQNSDLFHAALGGLGQFGIITRARIPLFPAPDMVRWARVVYASFEEYAADAESLVSRTETKEPFDYVEGFAFVNGADPVNGWGSVPILPCQTFDPGMVPSGSGPVLYCLEVALHYSGAPSAEISMRVEQMLSGLRYVRGLEFTADVRYVEFLTRVKEAEVAARASGTWDAPHPWLNLLVSAADIVDFDRHVFKELLKDGIGGPMLVYPLLKSKWNPETSLVVPNGVVFYLVALLRFSRPFPDGPRLEDLMAQNSKIIECCMANGYDFKVYLPSYKEQEKWRTHFGREWTRFEERKARYDPTGVLGPGQGIFTRKAHRPI